MKINTKILKTMNLTIANSMKIIIQYIQFNAIILILNFVTRKNK